MNIRHAISTYRGHTVPHFQIIEKRNRWFRLSGIVIVLSLAGLLFRELNLSIDFKGGAQLSYPFHTSLTVAQVSDTLNANGHAESQVQIVNGDTISIRTTTLTSNASDRDALLSALAKQAGINQNDINQTDVGPTWGSEISRKALFGLVVVLFAIFGYIWLRFEWKMALGANVALLHDLIITGGIYALVGRQVTPATVIAILTILGFSLYDTVVIYDKVNENTESTALVTKYGYADVVNMSLNQVMMRSVNTSLVVLLPVLSLLLFGGATLKDFAFAMFVGVTTGAYSSIFIAAPVLTILKSREQRYRQIEARKAVRAGAKAGSTSRRAANVGASGAMTDGEVVAATPKVASSAAASRATARTGGQSRPRPKSKRKPPAKRKRR